MAGSENTYSLRLSKQATEDFWRELDYLSFESESLGEKFYSDFQQTLDRITQNPFLYAEIILFIRRGLLRKFSYQIFYIVDEINYEIEVIGILHQKQNPNIILERLNLDF